MYNFCTLFDINYYTRGVLMYESLRDSVIGDFCLYVISFDNECFEKLSKLNLDFLIPIKLEDFENQSLLAVKSSASVLSLNCVIKSKSCPVIPVLIENRLFTFRL